MSITVKQLARWLEEDGHPACADQLLFAKPEDAPKKAREAADCAESDPYGYADDMARELPGQLRAWATEQERKT